MIAAELEAMSAPPKVLEAGREIDAQVSANVPVSRELAAYVRDWVSRTRSNNRWGK